MPRHAPFLALLLLAAPAVAQAPPRDHDVTPDDYFTLATITDLAVSPDGKRVAYCEARWDAAADNRRSDLWLVATAGGGRPWRLTGDRANDRQPKWDHDGAAVYVLGNRKRPGETAPPYDGSTQVWRVKLVPVLGPDVADREAADPQPVTRVQGGVTGYDFAAGCIWYTTDATATDDDAFARLRAKHKAEYGHGTRKVSELWRLNVRDWRAE